MGIERQRASGKALLGRECHDQLAAIARRQLPLVKIDVSGLERRDVLLMLGLHDEDLGLRKGSGRGNRKRHGGYGKRDRLTSLPQPVPSAHGKPSMRA